MPVPLKLFFQSRWMASGALALVLAAGLVTRMPNCDLTGSPSVNAAYPDLSDAQANFRQLENLPASIQGLPDEPQKSSYLRG